MFKAAAIVLLLGAVAACSDQCSNTLVKVVKAPGGRHAAALFQRDCGASTGFSTQISVLAPGDELTGSGNPFIADDNHGIAAVGSWQGSWADVQWLSPDHLLVRYADKSRVFKQSDQVAGVAITYQEAVR